MSISSPTSVDPSSATQQTSASSALGSGAVAGHHHHHGGGAGSEFATLLADLTDSTETDPTAGADSSVLTAASGIDPTSAAGAGAANSGATDSSDPGSLSSVLSDIGVNSTIL